MLWWFGRSWLWYVEYIGFWCSSICSMAIFKLITCVCVCVEVSVIMFIIFWTWLFSVCYPNLTMKSAWILYLYFIKSLYSQILCKKSNPLENLNFVDEMNFAAQTDLVLEYLKDAIVLKTALMEKMNEIVVAVLLRLYYHWVGGLSLSLVWNILLKFQIGIYYICSTIS